MSTSTHDVEEQVTLLELLDRLIDRGVVLTGDITISVADVDLIEVALNVLLASTERMEHLRAQTASRLAAPGARHMASAWYVYAIVPAGASLREDLTGVGGARVTLIRCEPLAAAASCVEGHPATLCPERALEHESTVEAIRRDTPALPVRYGTIFPDQATVARALEARGATLRADLARLGERAEVGLVVLRRASGSDDADLHVPDTEAAGDLVKRLRASSGPGARYLANRLNRYAEEERAREQAQRLAERIEAVLRPHVVESRFSLSPAPRLPLRAVFLVEPGRVETVREECRALRRSYAELLFLISGPWPPYSFVSPQGEEKAQRPWQRLPLASPAGQPAGEG